MSYSHEPQHQGSYPSPGAQQTQGQAQPAAPQIYAQQPSANGGQYPQQFQQPPMQQPMMVMAANFQCQHQNVMGKPLDAQGKRDWNHGLCSCTDRCGTFCLACWCPCVAYGEVASKLVSLQTTGQPHPDGGDSCGVPTWLYCFVNYLTGCACVMNLFQRSAVRRRYNIKGGGCTDCLCAAFCNPCMETQLIREIEDEENVLLGKGQQGGSAPSAQQPMQYQQQQPQQPQQAYQGQGHQGSYHGGNEKTPAYQPNQQV